MKKNFLIGAGLVLFVLGCVIRTEHKFDVHVTLEIKHIQEQAEEVLDYVEGKTDTLPGVAPAPAAEQPVSWVWRAIDLVNPIETAYAQELKNTDSATVKQIADSLRARHSQLEAAKRTGCLGENNRGYVELRDCTDASDAAKKNELQQLLAEENKDRKALYREIARLNADQQVAVGTVEKIYAMERLNRARSGEIFQLPDSGPDFDTFKNSATGQKLGGDAKAGAWVTIP